MKKYDETEQAYRNGYEAGVREFAESMKCGTCFYAKPTTFGKSKCYVECTNREHIERFCHRKISLKRQMTNPACKMYRKLTEVSKDD